MADSGLGGVHAAHKLGHDEVGLLFKVLELDVRALTDDLDNMQPSLLSLSGSLVVGFHLLLDQLLDLVAAKLLSGGHLLLSLLQKALGLSLLDLEKFLVDDLLDDDLLCGLLGSFLLGSLFGSLLLSDLVGSEFIGVVMDSDGEGGSSEQTDECDCDRELHLDY